MRLFPQLESYGSGTATPLSVLPHAANVAVLACGSTLNIEDVPLP